MLTGTRFDPEHGERQRGTVLLLMPAAVLIIVVLGAVAVDVGLGAVRARELRAVAASAANDTLAALDVSALRSDGTLTIDRDAALGIIEEAIAHGPLPDASVERLTIGQDELGRPEVELQLGLDVDLVLAPALPRAPDRIHISATERILVVS
jgi:hypothetical protein